MKLGLNFPVRYHIMHILTISIFICSFNFTFSKLYSIFFCCDSPLLTPDLLCFVCLCLYPNYGEKNFLILNDISWSCLRNWGWMFSIPILKVLTKSWDGCQAYFRSSPVVSQSIGARVLKETKVEVQLKLTMAEIAYFNQNIKGLSFFENSGAQVNLGFYQVQDIPSISTREPIKCRNIHICITYIRFLSFCTCIIIHMTVLALCHM